MIPYGRQDINQQDIKAVVDVLTSDMITQGHAVPQFEQAVIDYCGVKYAVAVSSATAALHIACLALGVGKGDIVWTSPNTFVASANCALYCGASVDFVDIDPRTYNISVEALREKLIDADRRGVLPKVIIPVHFGGQSCEMRDIKALADQYGIKIIEDASHAIGGSYLDEPLGNCRYADITVFSFHPVKIITTAEGGMALTNDDVLCERLRLLRSHGITRDTRQMVSEGDGPWYYQQIDLGFNYRMNDMQAALGVSQMTRLDIFCERRRVLAKQYDEVLHDFPITLPWQHPDTKSPYHLYPILCGGDAHDRLAIFERLRSKEIGVNVHYIPVHLQPFYQKFGFRKGDFPCAEQYYARAISLPMFPTIRQIDFDYVVATLKAALEGKVE
jgi:UDP-4-amino-4,6-dideoxy-N-acetyl-beta-L-altrosamine transaminase